MYNVTYSQWNVLKGPSTLILNIMFIYIYIYIYIYNFKHYIAIYIILYCILQHGISFSKTSNGFGTTFN